MNNTEPNSYCLLDATSLFWCFLTFVFFFFLFQLNLQAHYECFDSNIETRRAIEQSKCDGIKTFANEFKMNIGMGGVPFSHRHFIMQFDKNLNAIHNVKYQ